MTEPQRTHWDGCGWTGGPAHYECLLREAEALTGRIVLLEAKLAQVRREALEEALRICDALGGGCSGGHGYYSSCPHSVAAAIRALKDRA